MFLEFEYFWLTVLLQQPGYHDCGCSHPSEVPEWEWVQEWVTGEDKLVMAVAGF